MKQKLWKEKGGCSTFSKMLQKATGFEPISGDVTGTCCMCGEHTTHGNMKQFKANFTSSDYISHGDVVCEYCQHLVENSNTYRRSMYLLTKDEFKTFKKQDMKEVLFNLPSDEPFYLYLTDTYQKVGWVWMNQLRNEAGSNYVKVLVDYDTITFTVPDLREKYELFCKLRELKIKQESLSTCNLEFYEYKRIDDKYGLGESRKIMSTLMRYKGNDVWNLACMMPTTKKK